MSTFVDFVTRLVYGTASEAEITPSHSARISANPSPSGSGWLSHHVDRMLPAFEAWMASQHLPPTIPWDGSRPEPWDSSSHVPLGTDLDGSFTGIANSSDL